MRPLAATELLAVWEWGAQRHSVDRALALLGAACDDRSREELADLPLGRRDALLLELRRQSFGPHLEATAACPRCGEQVDFDLEVPDLLAAAPVDDAGSFAASAEGFEVEGRLATSRDLAAVTGCPDAAAGRLELLRRCVCSARRAGHEVPTEELPESVVGAVGDAIEERDPLSWIELDVRCPACGHRQSAPLDVAALLWTEIEAEAHRLLLAVHRLASAYGWREGEILALDPRRRQYYLERVD